MTMETWGGWGGSTPGRQKVPEGAGGRREEQVEAPRLGT